MKLVKYPMVYFKFLLIFFFLLFNYVIYIINPYPVQKNGVSDFNIFYSIFSSYQKPLYYSFPYNALWQYIYLNWIHIHAVMKLLFYLICLDCEFYFHLTYYDTIQESMCKTHIKKNARSAPYMWQKGNFLNIQWFSFPFSLCHMLYLSYIFLLSHVRGRS